MRLSLSTIDYQHLSRRPGLPSFMHREAAQRSQQPVSVSRIIVSCLLALSLHDPETLTHTLRGTYLALRLARCLELSKSERVHLEWGALLHDIGKLAIPVQILHKQAQLTEDEWAIIRQHPVNAREFLAPHARLHPALSVPYSHHEKWDGSGYPQGLKGEAIPWLARIFAVADVWDALVSKRAYRPAWPKAEACQYIHDLSGIHFDPKVVQAFSSLSVI